MKNQRQDVTHSDNLEGPFWLDPTPVAFPPTHLALKEPNGLLAVGGDLTPDWLRHAYSKGIFPWFSEDEPILWWTPSPRSVLFLNRINIRKSLRKVLKKTALKVTFDTQFDEVIEACAYAPRPGQDGTWITEEMLEAYRNLHQLGIAHSVEVWQGTTLVGGLYGVSIGRVFFGESMFSNVSNASKIGFTALCAHLSYWGFRMIDTQMETDHLNAFGAELINRDTFEHILKEDTVLEGKEHSWTVELDWAHFFSP